MQEQKIFSGTDHEEIWQEITHDIECNEMLLQYSIVIKYDGKEVALEIDIDPGGGFESGYQTTKFSSFLQNSKDFKFAIHHQGFIDEIGKFFGMQDIEIGYPEFDKKVIVKTNDETKVRSVFADEKIRSVFMDLINYSFHITHHTATESNVSKNFLELNIEEGITDPVFLRNIYDAFCLVLAEL